MTSFTSNPDNFFQTTDSIEDAARKANKRNNKNGSPIKLQSKLLAVISDPDDDRYVYVAEAAGCVRRVNIETGKINRTYTGPVAPLNCLALSTRTPRTLFAGCWDKSVWSWLCVSGKQTARYTGHGDFVKAVTCVVVHGTELLITGAADAVIRVWDIEANRAVSALKGHTRGILSLVVDPSTTAAAHESTGVGNGDAKDDDEDGVTLFSSDSTREIRKWCITPSSSRQLTTEPILVHETSITQLYFPAYTDADDPPDLYTASADKSTLCLSRTATPAWKADTVLAHPDFVRAVLVDGDAGVVVTACRDEEVRIWDKSSGELVYTYSGHWEEVLGLAFARKDGVVGVVSVGIDGTVRWWGIGKGDIARAKEEERREQEEKEGAEKEKSAEVKDGLMTEEEEAELAALMEDSD
ncbi:WD40 repeat-like protein [Pseudovirgaria hyperparasitica]|uniref:WD40 repeat-like protein n=1 Tax=Pseudovirgaria hyperparasitica TaxID=470096 RepID=A0A6A6W178_9PEZI|nr:WD40 repeat-like protein [Pseudovirgaria hyperparasitica]KAF2755690.1 WD40 repeat-like protein [Pseudovirgaria hyperparasitica]